MKHYVLAATALFATSASVNAATLDYSFLTDYRGDYQGVQRLEHDNHQDTFSVKSLNQYTSGQTLRELLDSDHTDDTIVTTPKGLGVSTTRADTEDEQIANNEGILLSFNNETHRIDRLLSLTFYEEDYGDEEFVIYDYDGNRLFSGSVNVKGREGDFMTIDLVDSDNNAGLAGSDFILAVTAPAKPGVKRGLRLAGASGHIAEPEANVSAVPLPATALFLLSGIGGLAFATGRKKSA